VSHGDVTDMDRVNRSTIIVVTSHILISLQHVAIRLSIHMHFSPFVPTKQLSIDVILHTLNSLLHKLKLTDSSGDRSTHTD